jgi:hypothetical protein
LLEGGLVHASENMPRTRRSPPDVAGEQERRTRARHSPPRNATSRHSTDGHAGPSGPLGSDPRVTHEPTMQHGYGWTHPRLASGMPHGASRPPAYQEGFLQNMTSTATGPLAASHGHPLPNPLHGHAGGPGTHVHPRGGAGTQIHPGGGPSAGEDPSTPAEAMYGGPAHHMQGSVR